MKKGKGTQYQSNAKRRNKDALGRPMRSPSFGLISTPNGYVVSEFVANQVMRKHPSLIPAFDMVTREKPIYKDGKRVHGKSRTITRVKPIAFKYALSVRNAVRQWALDQFAHVERKVMRKANDHHRNLSSAFKRIKNDKFRKNGTIKEDVTIGEHARMIRSLEAAKPPIALIGLEMIRQGVIL